MRSPCWLYWQAARDRKPRAALLKQELELSSPIGRWSLDTQAISDKQSHTLSSDSTVGLSGELHQYWSGLVSTSVAYQFRFSPVHDDAQGSIFGNSPVLQQKVFLGSAYHFGEREKILLQAGLTEELFPHRISEAAAPRLDQAWVPELLFATRNRVLSLAIGDLFVGGGLSFLAPRQLADYSVRAGFKQIASFGFERPVGETDIAGGSLSIEHQTQNTSLEDRSGFSLLLRFSYGLTFIQ